MHAYVAGGFKNGTENLGPFQSGHYRSVRARLESAYSGVRLAIRNPAICGPEREWTETVAMNFSLFVFRVTFYHVF